MIESLELCNFQSHKKSVLKFAPGVNIIIGPSDSGKTAIIRALRWLVWNRPLGNEIRSNWGGDTNVSITISNLTSFDAIDDSIIIIREKGKENTYELLGVIDMGIKLFKAFGNDVPEEIQQALNLNEINLQQQLDSPFLLSKSSGDVAKHFNRVAHLDQIDNGLKNVQGWLRAIEQNINSDSARQTSLEEDLKEFADLDKFETEVEVLERLHSDMITKINQKRELSGLVEDLQDVNEQIAEQTEILKAEPLLNKILGWIDTRDQLLSDQTSLQSEIDSIVETEASLKHWKGKAETLQQEFDEVFPDICPLCNKPK